MDEKTKARYTGDIEYFSAKLEKDSSSMLFIPLASAYLKLGQNEEARRVLLSGLDANPDLSVAKTLLAQSYIGLGQMEDAKSLLTEVRVIDSANYLAEKLLGDIYRAESETKKAIISYKNAYAAAPEDGELKNLIEQLLSESGLDAAELLDDRPIGADDEELLETLGQELAEEVRQEIGETGQTIATDEEVKQTVDEIVGSVDEDSLDIYAEDDGNDAAEMEEEHLASLDDEIVPTESLEKYQDDMPEPDASRDETGLPDEMADISGLAAELGSELGLNVGAEPEKDDDENTEAEPAAVPEPDIIEKPEPEPEPEPELQAAEAEEPPADEITDEEQAADELFAAEPETPQTQEPALFEIQDTGEIPAEINTDDVAETKLPGSDMPEFELDNLELSEIEAIEGDFDELSEAVKEPEKAEDTDACEPETAGKEQNAQDDIETAAPEIIARPEAGHAVIDVQAEEPPAVDFSAEIDELKNELSSEDFSDEPETNRNPEQAEPYHISDEDKKIIEGAKAEISKEEKINEELAILFAMEELEEKAKSGQDIKNAAHEAEDMLEDVKKRYKENLDSETCEQVSKLENLLELIKSNSK